MLVHLNITLDEALYTELKARTPPKRISAFIAGAVREKLGPSRAELDAAYRAAAKERWRGRLAEEWNATETEVWPE